MKNTSPKYNTDAEPLIAIFCPGMTEEARTSFEKLYNRRRNQQYEQLRIEEFQQGEEMANKWIRSRELIDTFFLQNKKVRAMKSTMPLGEYKWFFGESDKEQL